MSDWVPGASDPAVTSETAKAAAAVKTGADDLRRFQPHHNQVEDEAWALVDTFDNRLTEAERRIDRVLARLNVE